jgi:serine protease Do
VRPNNCLVSTPFGSSAGAECRRQGRGRAGIIVASTLWYAPGRVPIIPVTGLADGPFRTVGTDGIKLHKLQEAARQAGGSTVGSNGGGYDMLEPCAPRKHQPAITAGQFVSFSWFSALIAAMLVCIAPAASQASATNNGYADLVARLWPAVVSITVSIMVPVQASEGSKSERTAPDTEADFAGSGFIIDPSGYIVTNRHVVINAFSITVTLSDGTRLPAKVIGHPPAIDVALLKVDAEHPLPAVQLADSEMVRVGDKVLAIGNPLGFGETVTAGIVSALNRNTGESPYDNFIQTDAAINHGNSGGPLLNMQGQVIGVDTELVTPNATSTGSIGLGLAIPSDDVAFAIAELRKYGRVRPGWIGARLQQITPDLAKAFGVASTGGALIAAVDEEGPADGAGLRPGDVIQTFDGRTPTDVRALMRMIAETPLGHDVVLGVRREHDERLIHIMVSEYPPAEMVSDFPFQLTQPPRSVEGDSGLQLFAISDAVRRRLHIAASVKGVAVAAVRPGSPADRAGLRPQDVILQIQGKEATNPKIVETALQRARDKGVAEMSLLVVGPAGQNWLAFPAVPRQQSNDSR